MSRYLRLTYASRATFPPVPDGVGFHPEVGRILVQSRRNNQRQRLVGGLYFADGCFFQVLEGRREDVEALYARLEQDPRHQELQVLERREIPAPAFRGWAMKHVPDAPEVKSLMARHGRVGFDPYGFPPALVTQMVDLLLGAPGSVEREDDAEVLRERTLPRLLGAAGVAVMLVLAVMLLR